MNIRQSMAATIAVGIMLGNLTITYAQAPLAKTSPAPAGKQVKLPFIKIDRAKRQVVIESKICLRKGVLELLLCRMASDDGRWASKEHESVLHTKARPSHVHAALLLLGLTPGKPAEWIEVDDDTGGRFMSPRGAGLKISMRFRKKDGVMTVVDAANFIKSARDKKAKAPKEWIFVGSEILPGSGYLADGRGGGYIISVANFAASVIDVPFESTQENSMQEFIANTDSIPPLKTPVEVVITVLPGADKAPHARAVLMVDRGGDFYWDGRKIARGELSTRAEKFRSRHDKGKVVIMPDPNAAIADIAWARTALRVGGVRLFSQRWPGDDLPVLPHTPAQIEDAMKEWDKMFAKPGDFINDPAEEALLLLGKLRGEQKYLKGREKVLADYCDRLEKKLRVHKAKVHSTTKPTTSSAVE